MEGNNCRAGNSASLAVVTAPRRVRAWVRRVLVGFAASAMLAGGLGFFPEMQSVTSAQEPSSTHERGNSLQGQAASVQTDPPLTADLGNAPSETQPESATAQLPTPTSETSTPEGHEGDSHSADGRAQPEDDDGRHPDGDEGNTASADPKEITASDSANPGPSTEVQRSHEQSPSRNAMSGRKAEGDRREGKPADSTATGASASEGADVEAQVEQIQPAKAAYPYTGPPAGSRGSVQLERSHGLGATAATVAVTLIAGSALLSLRRFL